MGEINERLAMTTKRTGTTAVTTAKTTGMLMGSADAVIGDETTMMQIGRKVDHEVAVPSVERAMNPCHEEHDSLRMQELETLPGLQVAMVSQSGKMVRMLVVMVGGGMTGRQIRNPTGLSPGMTAGTMVEITTHRTLQVSGQMVERGRDKDRIAMAPGKRIGRRLSTRKRRRKRKRRRRRKNEKDRRFPINCMASRGNFPGSTSA